MISSSLKLWNLTLVVSPVWWFYLDLCAYAHEFNFYCVNDAILLFVTLYMYKKSCSWTLWQVDVGRTYTYEKASGLQQMPLKGMVDFFELWFWSKKQMVVRTELKRSLKFEVL